MDNIVGTRNLNDGLWEIVVDFTEIEKGGIDIKDLLECL